MKQSGFTFVETFPIIARAINTTNRNAEGFVSRQEIVNSILRDDDGKSESMRTILTLFMFGILALNPACRTYAPDAGHEIVLVAKPFFFGHGGVESEPVKTGRTYAALSTDGVDVYMQPQKFETELADTMTSDGVPITFHAIMILQVVDSVDLIRNFGPDWYKNNLEEQFKTMVRQAVRKRGMNETAISTTALDLIDAEIHDELLKFLADKKIPVRLVTMTVGKANPLLSKIIASPVRRHCRERL